MYKTDYICNKTFSNIYDIKFGSSSDKPSFFAMKYYLEYGSKKLPNNLAFVYKTVNTSLSNVIYLNSFDLICACLNIIFLLYLVVFKIQECEILILL